jgi:outer membrane protein TolC
MKVKLSVFGVLLVFIQTTHAQEKKDSIMRFSLEEAKAYALVNSPVVKNASLDLNAAKKKIWETTAIGLPQVSTKMAFSYMPEIPALYDEFSGLTSLPFWMYEADQQLHTDHPENPAFGQMPKTNPSAPLNPNDMKWSLNWDINVSQIIFSGSYLVGLQTAKIYKGLSELALSKSKYDLNESVENAYFLVLVAKENKSLLDSTYNNAKQILDNMKKMLEQGLLDETDVDQLQLTTNTIKNSDDMIDRQIGIAERLLKFQMGLGMDVKINLTDSINGLINNFDNNSILLQEFNVENNVDYKLTDTQAKLMKMNLWLNRSSFLPEISGFYQHEEVFNKNAITFNPPNLIGINASIPIFTSGSRIVKIDEAKISYEKALITKQQSSDVLKMSFEEAKSSYQNAIDKYNTTKENLKLSEKIYKKSIIKKQEGTISSTDLTQTQNQYLQSQTNYYSAIIDLAASKAKLEKLLISAH